MLQLLSRLLDGAASVVAEFVVAVPQEVGDAMDSKTLVCTLEDWLSRRRQIGGAVNYYCSIK
jgi:hypothetical protein